MTAITTIHQLLSHQAQERPDAIALSAPGRPPISFAQLLAQVNRTAGQLRAAGINRNDCVAIVLPNGPEMAAAFLATATVVTAAPLNPAYRAPEFDFYLADLNAKAILVPAATEHPAIAVAQSRNVRVLEAAFDATGPAGLFNIEGIAANDAAVDFAQHEDCAMVLHTSGTTSRPKIVPLTHRNLCASAANIRQTLELTPADQCLNVMPLFHIHGLIAAMLSSLSAGASVICTEGFIAPQFFGWIQLMQPTWYTAVPTMHQAILARASANGEIIAKHPLRFIRSSSAALPPAVARGLEAAFGPPVIEAYGMTEASHQMCSNPLPPRARKFGSVGPAAGPQVAIMDDHGNLLPAGATGEVVIRGDNVTAGYQSNDEANTQAFTQGWFRTGDQGLLDEDGYLILTGRLKEIINRGGETISPREIDDALLEHPDVAQAVAFAMPDRRLGEEVAAAIVLRDGRSLRENDLIAFAAARLSDAKVPKRILILDAIPKGPTGKIQRIGLARKLGVVEATEDAAAPKYAAPQTAAETVLVSLWAQMLSLDRVGVTDNFFDLGGDSITASRIIARVQDQLAVALPMLAFFETPTIRGMAPIIETAAAATHREPHETNSQTGRSER